MPIQNLTQLKRFAGRCGTSVPGFLDERFEGYDEDLEGRARVAAEALQPVVEATMASLSRETASLQDTVTQAVQRQLDMERAAP